MTQPDTTTDDRDDGDLVLEILKRMTIGVVILGGLWIAILLFWVGVYLIPNLLAIVGVLIGVPVSCLFVGHTTLAIADMVADEGEA